MFAEPISLYVDLEPGEAPDLEVVARAAIAWAEAIKEIAFLLDPGIEVRIELKSGTEGSLSLNGIIKALRGSKKAKKELKKDLRTVVIAVLVWFALQGAEYTFEAIVDYLRGQDDPAIAELNDEQINAIADRVAVRIGPKVAQEQKKQIFTELDRDASIRGVGVSATPSRKPDRLIPKSEFAKRANFAVDVRVGSERRRSQRVRAQLVSPVLKGVPRSWRFQVAGLPEFGAAMKDKSFLAAIEVGRVHIPLSAGVEMEFDLHVKEENAGGVWVPIERTITRVYQPKIDRAPELPFSESE